MLLEVVISDFIDCYKFIVFVELLSNPNYFHNYYETVGDDA